jgi:uncharacterized protein
LFRLLTPHHRVESVCRLTPTVLEHLGLEALLLDVDGTLKRYAEPEVSGEVAAWLAGLRAAGIRVCLVSNGRPKRIGRFAEKLGLPFVALAMKPLPRGCRAAIRRLGLPPERTAMVGDQLFADVPAARLAGVTSILVESLHPEDEPWYTRLKRPLERWLLRRTKAPSARGVPDRPAD